MTEESASVWCSQKSKLSTEDPDEMWLVTLAQKKEMYGSLRVPVGGKNEPDDPDGTGA